MHYPRYSPDGAFVAYTHGGQGTFEIWIHEIATGRERKLGGSGIRSFRCGHRAATSSTPTRPRTSG